MGEKAMTAHLRDLSAVCRAGVAAWRRPRPVLWGGRRGDAQIGSSEDRWAAAALAREARVRRRAAELERLYGECSAQLLAYLQDELNNRHAALLEFSAGMRRQVYFAEAGSVDPSRAAARISNVVDERA
jgi:glycerol-3-phosphate dehydrogenase